MAIFSSFFDVNMVKGFNDLIGGGLQIRNGVI